MRVTVSDCTTQCLEPFSLPAKDVCQALSAASRSSSALNRWGFRRSKTIDSGSPLVVRCHRIGTNLLKISFRFILEGRTRAFSHGPIVTWNSPANPIRAVDPKSLLTLVLYRMRVLGEE